MPSSPNVVKASAAAAISCTSLNPLGKVGLLPGWPLRVSRLSAGPLGGVGLALSLLPRLDPALLGRMIVGGLTSPQIHC
jgi:hypothetical protein